jgi:hypothetical protein
VAAENVLGENVVGVIDSHREKIRAKLNVKDGTELLQRAVLWRLENG